MYIYGGVICFGFVLFYTYTKKFRNASRNWQFFCLHKTRSMIKEQTCLRVKFPHKILHYFSTNKHTLCTLYFASLCLELVEKERKKNESCRKQLCTTPQGTITQNLKKSELKTNTHTVEVSFVYPTAITHSLLDTICTLSKGCIHTWNNIWYRFPSLYKWPEGRDGGKIAKVEWTKDNELGKGDEGMTAR